MLNDLYLIAYEDRGYQSIDVAVQNDDEKTWTVRATGQRVSAYWFHPFAWLKNYAGEPLTHTGAIPPSPNRLLFSEQPQKTQREQFITELCLAPGLDENGYICEKKEAIAAFDRASAQPSQQRGTTEKTGE